MKTHCSKKWHSWNKKIKVEFIQTLSVCVGEATVPHPSPHSVPLAHPHPHPAHAPWKRHLGGFSFFRCSSRVCESSDYLPLSEVICVHKAFFITLPLTRRTALWGRRAGSESDVGMKALTRRRLLLGFETELLLELSFCGEEKETKTTCRRESSGDVVITQGFFFLYKRWLDTTNYSSSFEPSDLLITWMGFERGFKRFTVFFFHSTPHSWYRAF